MLNYRYQFGDRIVKRELTDMSSYSNVRFGNVICTSMTTGCVEIHRGFF